MSDNQNQEINNNPDAISKAPIPIAGFTVRQEEFEGPLIVLLELIEKEKLSINQISLARVADEYVAHIKTLAAIDKEELAEFLVVAAQLILIKSRSLLPNLAVSEEEEMSIEELERRLAEFKRLKELARGIKEIWSKGDFIRTREYYSGFDPIFYPPKKISLVRLKKVFEEIIRAIPKIEKIAEEKIKRIITLEEKLKEFQILLQEKVERAFSELVSVSRDKLEVIVSFLAILELAKQKFLSLTQEEPFGEIRIKKE